MAGFKVGSTDVSTVKIGSTQVEAIYVGQTEVWSNAIPATVNLTGTYTTSDVGDYRYVRFTGSGTIEITDIGNLGGVDYAIIGGGGGSSYGGGGGGGVYQNTITTTLATSTVTIGAGGGIVTQIAVPFCIPERIN